MKSEISTGTAPARQERLRAYQVNWSASTNASCKLALLEVTGYPADGELQTSLAGSANLFFACGFAFAASRHDNVRDVRT